MFRSIVTAARQNTHSIPRRFFSAALSQHKDTSYNNKTTPFEFTDDSKKKIAEVLKKFPENYKASAVMPILFIAQEQNNNWLPLTAMDKVAELLDMPPMRVYEVATFYTMYNREPVGKFHIQVCGTTTCMCMGSDDIKKAAMDFAKLHHEGEVSKDGMWCVTEVECLGACTNAPMVQVNNQEFYENLTPETMVKVMKGLVDGTAVVGPQNGQAVAEGPQGSITLKDYKDKFPKFRDIDGLIAEKAAEAKKAAAEKAAEAKKA
eukprot:TRINITY_DN79815_c0_g1_i1.p1 TRINITY_DN79815_c0_g1~~TRINITY_DN79815_c0_g1_i1.p1  ORF type:complete len:262 (+),score=50.74 TRINITY_DN79815_c0_g1_i1:20-805(+)